MKKLGTFCKAYPVDQLRQFRGWKENPQPYNSAEQTSDTQTPPPGYLFLQEDFTVTRGIFLNEDVVFDSVTQDWKDYCQTVLNFSVPA